MLLQLLGKKGARPMIDINNIIDRLFYHKAGQILVSAVFGVALAFMFQKVCKGEHCIVVQPPPLDDIEKYVYTLDGVCYRYVPKVSECVPKK